MKRNYIKLIVSFSFICTLFFTGCYSVKVLDVPLVSMTKTTYPSTAELKIKSVGEVRGKYCSTLFEFGRIGMMDSIIKEIQTKYKVDYVKDITVSMHGNDCMDIVGEGIVVQQ